MEFRYVQHFELSAAKSHDELPENIKAMLANLPYKELVRPLVWSDYRNKHTTIKMLSVRFGIAQTTIYDMITGGAIKKSFGFPNGEGEKV